MLVKTVPYEILIRYDENGKFMGASSATHELVIADDGITVVARKIVGPIPYASPADPAFVAVLGQALSDALSAYSQLQSKTSL